MATELDMDTTLADEHERVTTDRDRPLPREMGPHVGSWVVILLCAALFLGLSWFLLAR